MNLGTAYRLPIKRRVEGDTDAHGNPVVSWSTVFYLDAYSIAPAYSNEPFEAGREAVITGLTVLAPKPKKFTLDEDDLVVIDGVDYSIKGEVANWNQGPFGFEPGISVTLEKVGG